MLLLENFLQIINQWESTFSQKRTAKRALCQALGSLICMGRATLTSVIQALGNEQKVWSPEYFLHSRSPWSPEDLFKPVIVEGIQYCHGPLVGIVMDDTTIRKTGKRIRQAFFSRDPMSPPFHVNLRLGIRFLQFALILPLHQTVYGAARTLPILFEEVSAAKKPREGRKDYQERLKEYKELSKTHNLPLRTVAAIKKMRESLDHSGAHKKIMVIIGDGAFCNRTIFQRQIERTELLVRCRKDLKLARRSTSPNRFYSEETFSPLDIYQDSNIEWQKTRIFFGGRKRTVKFKELSVIYWQTGAKRRPLRLFIIEGHNYRIRKTGRMKKRETGYLLTTLTSTKANKVLQLYFDRWQIEVNHREEKTTLRVGQAQLHNPVAVPKQPAFVVAAYSALLLAGLKAYGPFRTDVYCPLPRWRANATRPSCLDLVNLLRNQIVENKHLQHELGIQVTFQRLTTVLAA